MARRRLISKRITILVLAMLTLGIGGGLALASRSSGPVDVAFLGDSYTWGYGASAPEDGYAYLVARAEHWSSDVVGLSGAGYARRAPNRRHETIAAGIRAVIAARPRLLIVECGHNDSLPGVSLPQTAHNALIDLRRLRRAMPRTTIVVLGPVWLDGTPSARVLAVRAAVHAAQRQVARTRWIDPIAQGWFTGRLADHTGDDATMINYRVGHPDDKGYAHMAQLLETDLRVLGVRASA